MPPTQIMVFVSQTNQRVGHGSYSVALAPLAPPKFASCCTSSVSACVVEIGLTVGSPRGHACLSRTATTFPTHRVVTVVDQLDQAPGGGMGHGV